VTLARLGIPGASRSFPPHDAQVITEEEDERFFRIEAEYAPRSPRFNAID
jgi:hypothetical protein